VGGSSQTLALHLRTSQVVKAFNTLNYRILGSPRGPMEEPLVLFLAGDDQHAKRLVAGLIRDIGFVPVDTGSLAEGDEAQGTSSPIYDRALIQEEAEEALALLRP
jgi:8-hydroxy-5-deazaflavin:NADPH oxidoreductase